MGKPDQQVCDPAALPTLIPQKRGGGGGGGGVGGCMGCREVERLLLSFSKSTVNNAGNYRGETKQAEGGRKTRGGG